MNNKNEKLTPDINPDTGNFVVPAEQERIERQENIRARVMELLKSDLESVVSSLAAMADQPEEEFHIEIDAEDFIAGGLPAILLAEDIEMVVELLQSPEAQEIYRESNLDLLRIGKGLGTFDAGKMVVRVNLKIRYPEQVEPSPELEKIRFSNMCAYCHSEVVVEKGVPASSAGKWKKTKGKDKSKGEEYRDWDYGEVPCPGCAKQGKESKIFLFYREYK